MASGTGGRDRRVLFVRNLPFGVTRDEMYEVFGRFGTVRQVRVGVGQVTRGTGFVVYNDTAAGVSALDALNGYRMGSRYLTVTPYNPAKRSSATAAGSHGPAPLSDAELAAKRAELDALKEKYGLEDEDDV